MQYNVCHVRQEIVTSYREEGIEIEGDEKKRQKQKQKQTETEAGNIEQTDIHNRQTDIQRIRRTVY